LTANSGTFITEDEFPTQILNVGASFQIRNRNSTFQEISLSRLSIFKSSHLNIYPIPDSTGNSRNWVVGYDQKSFIMSLRYEYGKMFGSTRKPFRFGVSGIIESTIYSYQREEQSTRIC